MSKENRFEFTDEEIKKMNIYTKLMFATNELGYVEKNLSVPVGGRSYKGVSEVDVLKAVKPIELKYGIYSYPYKREAIVEEFLEKSNGRIDVFVRLETIYRFVNIDKPLEFVDIATYGDGVDTQDKAPGKAMTYADKYALLKAYKIQTGDDPDANASEEYNKVAPKPKKPATAKAPATKPAATKQEWTWGGGRFKGLTMLESSERPDFDEYIDLLKDTKHFTKEIEAEYNKANKVSKLSNKIEEREI